MFRSTTSSASLTAGKGIVSRFLSAASPLPVPEAQCLRLNTLRDNPGARKKKVRLGRGRGSGCGKTSGRGQKGQRARNSVRLGFEGGQTPLQKRLPKVNSFDFFAKNFERLPIGRVQRWIDTGRLRNEGRVTMRDLVTSGCLTRVKEGVVLEKGGVWKSEVEIEVTEATPEAAEAVVRGGGKVRLAWYNRLGLRALIKPEKWLENGRELPKWAQPPPKLQKRYPERDDSGVPFRGIATVEECQGIIEAWTRDIHPRQAGKVSL